MSLLNGISGRIGEPEGQSRLLNPSRVEEAVAWVENNQQIIETNVISGGSTYLWCRTNAAGTKIVGNGLTVSRTSEGVYAYTLSAIAGENYGVVVTASAEAGNGGDGTVKFQAYDSHLIEDVANRTGGTAPMDLLNTTNGKTYTLDPGGDVVVIHDLANFTTDPAGTSMGGEPLSGFGCLDREGRLLWMGEDGAGTSKHLIAYDTTNSTIYDFGDIATSDFGGWSWSIIAAEYNSGSPKLWIDIIGAGGLKRYTPNLGTETLGAAAFSYTGFNHEGSQPATWDDSGTYFYAQQSTYLYRVLAAASSGNGLSEHDYPSAYVTGNAGGNNCLMVWDTLRKKLYVPLTNGPGGGCAILSYTPASALANDNGTWELLLNTASATSPNIWLDQASGVLLVQEGNYVHRYLIGSMQLVDTVDVSALTSPAAGVPETKARLCYYSHPYAYIFTHIAAATPTGKHLRISYQGAELSTTGYGAYISSVLTTMYEITGNSTFNAYLFRSLSPIIRADGEHTVVVVT